LDSLSYSQGDTVTYSIVDNNNNECYSGSFVISGTEKSLDITLSVRSDRIQGAGNRDVTVTNVGGKAVSTDNPLPVTVISSNDFFDLTNNPDFEWSIRTDGQPIYVEANFQGNTYRKLYTYNTGGIRTKESKWVKQ